MTNPYRTSSIGDRLQHSQGLWREINRMQAIYTIPGDEITAARLGIADLSFFFRFGVKGAGAAAWLENQGIQPPSHPNTWCPLPDGGLIARLGMSEFLIEDNLSGNVATQLMESQQFSSQVYPVLRQDAEIALCGSAVNELLLQTCSFNFLALSLAERPVVLTSMAGVAVIVMPNERAGQILYRIWCDGTYGAYLWRTLVAIAQELGGGAIGSGSIGLLQK